MNVQACTCVEHGAHSARMTVRAAWAWHSSGRSVLHVHASSECAIGHMVESSACNRWVVVPGGEHAAVKDFSCKASLLHVLPTSRIARR